MLLSGGLDGELGHAHSDAIVVAVNLAGSSIIKGFLYGLYGFELWVKYVRVCLLYSTTTTTPSSSFYPDVLITGKKASLPISGSFFSLGSSKNQI